MPLWTGGCCGEEVWWIRMVVHKRCVALVFIVRVARYRQHMNGPGAGYCKFVAISREDSQAGSRMWRFFFLEGFACALGGSAIP